MTIRLVARPTDSLLSRWNQMIQLVFLFFFKLLFSSAIRPYVKQNKKRGTTIFFLKDFNEHVSTSAARAIVSGDTSKKRGKRILETGRVQMSKAVLLLRSLFSLRPIQHVGSTGKILLEALGLLGTDKK